MSRLVVVLAAALLLTGAGCADSSDRETARPDPARSATSAGSTPGPTVGQSPPEVSSPARPTVRSSPTPGRAPAAVRVVAVGDIACPPGVSVTATSCQQQATAGLTADLDPDLVLALGDLQYENGSAAEFAGFDRAWGPLAARTEAVPGNHDYHTAGAAGYYGETGGRPPGWRVVTAGAWRLYLLNTVCEAVDCEAETAWLRADLARHPTRCSALVMHYPRFSSGEHGSDETMRRFWDPAYAAGVDLALAGHDHTYERFVALTPTGVAAPGRGLVSFVVGTGGRSLYRFAHPAPGSAYAQKSDFGVLALELRRSGFAWAFHTVDGDVPDTGSARCH